MTIHKGAALHLSRKSLLKLESPPYIRFWWGEDEKVLLVTGWSEQDAPSFTVNYLRAYKDKRGFRTRNTKNIKAILSCMGLSSEETYAFLGDYVPEMKMIAFKLHKAKEVVANGIPKTS
jgi:hypothetical protein